MQDNQQQGRVYMHMQAQRGELPVLPVQAGGSQ
jgi:hypothetical protein